MCPQTVVICCLAIAHSTLCYDTVDDVMSSSEINMVFQEKANSVPKHELVHVVNYRTRDYNHDGKTIVGPTQRVWLRTFGADINLWLYPAEKVLMHENTPVYHATYSKYDPVTVAFEKQDGAMKKIAQLYVDHKHRALLTISTGASGVSQINGHIASHGLTVRSLPENVVKEYLRTRRSINETEYTESKLTYVVVYETPKSIDGEVSLHAFNRTNLRERTDRSVDEEEIPYTLYPQILLVVENSLYRKLGNDDTKLLEYLVAFWNGVDLKYRNLERPRIRLSISAIIIAMEPRSTPYISDRIIGDGVFDANFAMLQAKYFFSDIKAKFPLDTYDIAVTITSQKLGGEGNDATVGFAFGGQACVKTPYEVKGIVMVHDRGDFFGIHVAAHELGHSLGMEHDDDDFIKCKNSDGYIMANSTASSKNSWKFSQCSLDNFDTLLHNNELKCLYNVPVITGKSLPKTMPGKLLSQSDVCKANGFVDVFHYRSEVLCGNVICRDERGHPRGTSIPVPEGTPCGSLPNMFCLRRRCTQIPEFVAKEVRKRYPNTD